MNVEVYRGWFIAGSLTLMLVAATPALTLFINMPSGSERFSELWLLGPDKKAEDYPFNVRVNETYRVYVGVGNHLGYSAYYRVDVKFRNQTQPLPDLSNSISSPLSSTYEFRFLLTDGGTWERRLTFSFQGEPAFISDVLINNEVFPVSCSSTWDQQRSGFYYQIFFELWQYNVTSQSFRFHNRFVGIWLNVTSS